MIGNIWYYRFVNIHNSNKYNMTQLNIQLILNEGQCWGLIPPYEHFFVFSLNIYIYIYIM